MCTFAKIDKRLNTRKLLEETIGHITRPETAEEIREMALLLLEEWSGFSRAEILAGREMFLTPELQHKLYDAVRRINQYEPVQYIIGKAWFYGREFRVTPDVLIPRPETEELIDEVKRIFSTSAPLRMLDAGTGSGCIAITLKLEYPQSRIYALDISEAALHIARTNAENLAAQVDFILCDFLHAVPAVYNLDVIVSNPPYVTAHEKATLSPSVVHFEPHQALFVPDEDPLIFYHALAEKGKLLLNQKGLIITEINERLGQPTVNLFRSAGYQAHVLHDISGKERIVVAKRM